MKTLHVCLQNLQMKHILDLMNSVLTHGIRIETVTATKQDPSFQIRHILTDTDGCSALGFKIHSAC